MRSLKTETARAKRLARRTGKVWVVYWDGDYEEHRVVSLEYCESMEGHGFIEEQDIRFVAD